MSVPTIVNQLKGNTPCGSFSATETKYLRAENVLYWVFVEYSASLAHILLTHNNVS